MIELTPDMYRPKGRKLYEYVPDYVLFDLETTGLSTRFDEIVEIGAVKVRGGVIVDEFATLINPGKPISAVVSQVNGIYDDMVKNCQPIYEVLGDFLDFIGGFTLVGHNISGFDMRFICRDAFTYLGKCIDNDYIDTVNLSRMLLPDMKHSLSDLANFYGISTQGAHRALADCRMNQLVYERLGKDLSEGKLVIPKCPRCGSPMTIRRGKYGQFYGCVGYPDCRGTRDINT